MKLIQTIKDIIYKIKDYDRLELAYCGLLDCVTGGILSKPNYTEEAIHEAINEHLQEQYKYVEEETIDKAIAWLKENADKYIVDCTPTYPDAPSDIIVGGMCWEDMKKNLLYSEIH